MANLKANTKKATEKEEKKEVKTTEQLAEQEEKKEEGVTAVATDNVPEGELKEDEDGSVTAYDGDGNPVGTVSAEEVKKAEENVTGVEVDSTSPMEQLKNETAPKVTVNTDKIDVRRKPTENVKIRLRVDHSCCIAMEQYDFKAGKVYTVPKNVKKILNRAGLLSPI